MAIFSVVEKNIKGYAIILAVYTTYIQEGRSHIDLHEFHVGSYDLSWHN